MYLLDEHLWFPNPKLANEDGLLAVGGDLSAERLLLAYQNGIFPWFSEGEPLLWWSPDLRMVLFPENLHVSKSMKQLLKQNKFRVTYNQDFKSVISACAELPRRGQEGTWITSNMIDAYLNLHDLGHAISVEVYSEHSLVGGLYGIYLKEKRIFCGESMFTRQSNASKYGFIKLVKQLAKEGVKLIDCQMHTAHLASLGAEEIPRETFLKYLNDK